MKLLGLHVSKKRVGVADRCGFILPLVHILFPNNLLLMLHIKFDYPLPWISLLKLADNSN